MPIYPRKPLLFEVQAPPSPRINPLDSCLWGHLNTLVYSAPIENEEKLYQRNLMPVKSFPTAPGPLKMCDSP
jgi:hypothetical protein